MKLYKIVSLLSIISLLFGACDDTNEILVKQRGAAVNPIIESINSGFFSFSDLENAYVEFVVGAEKPNEVNRIIIEVVYKGSKITMPAFTSVPATVRAECTELTEQLGFDLDDIELGDEFTFQVLVENKDGLITYSNAVINALVACPSNLEGTYAYAASGEGNGGLGALQTWTSTVTSVSLVKTGDTSYEIENALGGVMVDFYGGFGATPATAEISDVCDDISGSVNDGWNTSDYNGSVDENGVITLSWANPWGDHMDITLTPN